MVTSSSRSKSNNGAGTRLTDTYVGGALSVKVFVARVPRRDLRGGHQGRSHLAPQDRGAAALSRIITFRHRVITIPAPWMTTPDAADRHPDPLDRAVLLQRFHGISAAGWMITTIEANPWGKEQTVGPYRQGYDKGEGAHGNLSNAALQSLISAANGRVAVSPARPTKT